MMGRGVIVSAVGLALVGITALLAAALVLGGGSGVAAPGKSRSATATSTVRAALVAGTDPVTGATVSLARVKRKPVVLTVWASWCAACGRQAPLLRRFSREHRREAAVLGLDLQDEAADARAFYERHCWAFRSVADPEGRFAARLGVDEMPTTFVLDGKRRIVARIADVATLAELERALAEAKRAS